MAARTGRIPGSWQMPLPHEGCCSQQWCLGIRSTYFLQSVLQLKTGYDCSLSVVLARTPAGADSGQEGFAVDRYQVVVVIVEAGQLCLLST